LFLLECLFAYPFQGWNGLVIRQSGGYVQRLLLLVSKTGYHLFWNGVVSHKQILDFVGATGGKFERQIELYLRVAFPTQAKVFAPGFDGIQGFVGLGNLGSGDSGCAATKHHTQSE
jgi:hypothetical protein